MSTGDDIAAALRRAADFIDGMGGLVALDKRDILRENVRDANGNTVGFFRIGPKLESRA